jgi:hypothetical protein
MQFAANAPPSSGMIYENLRPSDAWGKYKVWLERCAPFFEVSVRPVN